MKLKTRIVAIIVSVTVLCIGTLTVYSTNEIQDQYVKVYKESLSDLVSSLKLIFKGKYYTDLDQKLDLFESIKREFTNEERFLKEMLKNSDTQLNKESINIVMNTYVQFDQRIIIYSHGNDKFLARKNAAPLLKLRNSANIPLSELMKTNRMSKGKFFVLIEDDKRLLVYIFFAKINKAPVNIALIKDITEEFIRQDDPKMQYAMSVQELLGFNEHVSKGTLETFITNSDGIILTSNNDKLLGKTFNIKEYFDDEELNNPIATCKDVDNMFICSTLFKHANVYIVAKMSVREAGYQANTLIASMISMAAIIVITSIAVSLIAVGKITRSLSQIQMRAQNIANANLSDPEVLPDLMCKEQPSNDEIGKLNEAVDLMVMSLGANITQLLQANTKQNRYETELNVAHDMQIGMLPNAGTIPKSDLHGFFAFMHPAKEVGGDFYDIFRIDDDHIALAIGDVSDKGVPAALFMSICTTTLRLLITKTRDISKSLYELNNIMSERNPSMMFVTLFVGILNEKTGEFKFGNAGHCLPYIVNGRQITELGNLSGPAIGAFEKIEYSEFKTTLKEGEYLFCYTDGISEAQNNNREFFSEEKIKNVLQEGKFVDERSLIYDVLDNVIDFRGEAEQSDDITMLCAFAKVKPKA